MEGHIFERILERIGTTIDGRYVIQDLLGVGGMGAVYKAVQTSVDRPVALKMILDGIFVGIRPVERFQREAKIACKLTHQNTVTVHDFGECNGDHYIVMEYVEGETLDTILQKARNKGLPAERALRITSYIAESLGEAHGLNLVHRDLKPGNIIVQQRFGRTDFARVLDFGLARIDDFSAADIKLTGTGQMLGTPLYCSPEQAQGLPLDGRSDIFSLGVVLYEMLVGRPPGMAETPRKVQIIRATQDLPPINEAAPDQNFSQNLVNLVTEMTRREPDDRLTAAALKTRLDKFAVRQTDPGIRLYDIYEQAPELKPPSTQLEAVGIDLKLSDTRPRKRTEISEELEAALNNPTHVDSSLRTDVPFNSNEYRAVKRTNWKALSFLLFGVVVGLIVYFVIDSVAPTQTTAQRGDQITEGSEAPPPKAQNVTGTALASVQSDAETAKETPQSPFNSLPEFPMREDVHAFLKSENYADVAKHFEKPSETFKSCKPTKSDLHPEWMNCLILVDGKSEFGLQFLNDKMVGVYVLFPHQALSQEVRDWLKPESALSEYRDGDGLAMSEVQWRKWSSNGLSLVAFNKKNHPVHRLLWVKSGAHLEWHNQFYKGKGHEAYLLYEKSSQDIDRYPGKLDIAIQKLKKATSLLPNYTSAWVNLCWAQFEKGLLKDAEATCKTAIKLSKEYGIEKLRGEAYLWLGSLAAVRGKRELAKDHYVKGYSAKHYPAVWLTRALERRMNSMNRSASSPVGVETLKLIYSGYRCRYNSGEIERAERHLKAYGYNGPDELTAALLEAEIDQEKIADSLECEKGVTYKYL